MDIGSPLLLASRDGDDNNGYARCLLIACRDGDKDNNGGGAMALAHLL